MPVQRRYIATHSHVGCCRAAGGAFEIDVEYEPTAAGFRTPFCNLLSLNMYAAPSANLKHPISIFESCVS
jgi:hypothetical protein